MIAMRALADTVFTASDLEQIPDDGNRYEVIDGALYVSTSPSLLHQIGLSEIFRAFLLYLEEQPIGRIVPGIGVLFDDHNAVIPDLVYYSNERKQTIEGVRLTGAPEIVIEILSPGPKNEARDRKVKRHLYSVNGVSEYWILDLESRTMEIHRAARTGGFRSKQVLHDGDIVTSPLLPGFQCEVTRLLPKTS